MPKCRYYEYEQMKKLTTEELMREYRETKEFIAELEKKLDNESDESKRKYYDREITFNKFYIEALFTVLHSKGIEVADL